MSDYRRIWVENALDVTGCEGPFELARQIEEGEVLDPHDMVQKDEALEMVESYAEDTPIACASCEIKTIEMDNFGEWVCPNCEKVYVKQ